MAINKNTVLLCILDGWGYSEIEQCNAIMQATTPTWDKLMATCPHSLIRTHGAHVGLPSSQMGNSEVGHTTIGAGRVVYQETTRIGRAILSKSFFNNQTLVKPVEYAANNNKSVHILGLLSDGGVHSHISHIKAMVELAAQKGASKIFVHAFLDGRDTLPKSAGKYLQDLEQFLAKLGKGKIATIIGRFFALDRDNRWERVSLAYNLLTNAQADYQYQSTAVAIKEAYLRDEIDEFISPTIIGEPVKINDDDVVIFMNFRSDRARELTEALILPDFEGFTRTKIPKIKTMVTLTKYRDGYPVDVAFPADNVTNSFGEYIANLGFLQLRIAETEKYPHITYFFNGGTEQPFVGEDRILIKSPAVTTYDLKPEMSAFEVTDKLITAINSQKYDVIICNFANSDMVGHTGNLKATIKAIETLDKCLSKIIPVITANNGHMLITADHGNSEQMCDYDTGEILTSHTTNLVPLIYVGNRANVSLNDGGSLADLAPTLLDLMQVSKPDEMQGCSLIAD